MMTARPNTKVTPEVLSMMIDLLPTITSLRDLCAITGLNLGTVRAAVAPFLAIMKLQGNHPQCGCGRDRFHPYGCRDSVAKIVADGRFPGQSAGQSAITLARQQAIIAEILTGDTFASIEQRMGIARKSARKYQRFMTPEQLKLRKQRELSRGPRAAPSRPFSDPLYARIAAAIPHWISPASRDDIISEMYVAVQDGTLLAEEIEANAKRFSNTVVNLYESRFGPRSLDERLFDDGTATLGDRIPDPSALAAFDRIHIGDSI